MTTKTKRAVAAAKAALNAAIVADLKADLYTNQNVTPKVGDVGYVVAGDDHEGGLGRVSRITDECMVTVEELPGYSFSWCYYGPRQAEFAKIYGNIVAKYGSNLRD